MGCTGSKSTKVIEPVAYEAPMNFLQKQKEQAEQVHLTPDKDDLSTVSTMTSPYKSSPFVKKPRVVPVTKVEIKPQKVEYYKFTKDKNEIIKIDVEGSHFECGKNFLTKHKDSGLEAMFSGRHQLPVKDGRAVVEERRPNPFGNMLEYLKTG